MVEAVSNEVDVPAKPTSWSLIRGCFWRTIGALGSGVLVGFVMGFFATITRYISPQNVTAREISFVQLTVILSILASSATYLYFDRKELKSRIQQLLPDLNAGMRRPASLLILLCIPFGVLGTIHWAITTPQIAKNFMQDASSIRWIAIAASFILVGPFAEEAFYRGLVWDRLSNAMPSWKVGTISAALFLGAHIFNGLLAPLLVLPLTIILTLLRMRRIGLGMCMLAHGIYNGTIILGNFVQTHSALFYAPV